MNTKFTWIMRATGFIAWSKTLLSNSESWKLKMKQKEIIKIYVSKRWKTHTLKVIQMQSEKGIKTLFWAVFTNQVEFSLDWLMPQ